MKLKLITLGVAAALAAPSAFAIDKATLETSFAGDPNSIDQLWISGATAPTASIYGGIKKLCLDADANGAPDDLHVYMETGAALPGVSAGGKVAAYACTLASSAKPTIIYHTFDSGSFEAYTPHLIAAGEVNPNVPNTLKKLKDITNAANTCAGPVLVGSDLVYSACGSISPTIAVGAANTGVNHYPILPVGGFSDTEYSLNQLNLGVSKSLGDIGFELASNVGQGFGLAASWKLYYDLQVDQFGAGTCTTGFSASGPNLTEACKPSIPAWKYQQVIAVASVNGKDASIFNKAYPAAGTIPAPSALAIERRVGTSGTQSGSNAYFLNQPCGTGIPGGALLPAGSNLAGSTTFGNVTIRSNSGSGNVKTNVSSDSTYRLGMLSLENGVDSGQKWAFVKLDGVSPTADTGAGDNLGKNRQTALNGDYRLWFELVGFVPNADTGEGAALINGIIGAWSDPVLTNLRGIFPTVFTGATGDTVSQFYKEGVACKNPVRN